MSPIRVGIVGLGIFTKGSSTSSWAAVAHLPALINLPDYEIVAVANSTVESAQRSIIHHNLPPSTKAYGSASDIANDPTVDLVIVCVKVGNHFALAKPAIENGKNVFVEWPLAASPAEAKELTELAATKGVKTNVGLQTRFDPVVQKMKETILSGKIGNVISSSAWICETRTTVDAWVKGLEHYLDIKSGGNEFTIIFGHFLDLFTYVLGDFTEVQGLLKSQYPTVPLIDTTTGEIVNPTYPKTSPDHIFVQGILENDAVASISLRKAKSTTDNISHRWIITGTEGEIEYTVPAISSQEEAKNPSFKLKIGRAEKTEEIETVADDSPAVKVPAPGTNTARMYDNFAKEGGEVVSFESALKTHELLERIAKSSGWEL